MTHIAAFFDFDKTLVEVESGRMAFRWLWNRRMIIPGYMAKVIAANLLYKTRIIPEDRFIGIMLSFYRGRRLDEFQQGAEDFWREYLQPYRAPAIMARLAYHRMEGHLLVLVSGSLRYILEPAARDLGFHEILSTDLERDSNGILTGKPAGRVCVGEEKRVRAAALAREKGINLDMSYAYGNNHPDIPLLEIVGHPFAVAPTSSLEKVARRKGWPVIGYR